MVHLMNKESERFIMGDKLLIKFISIIEYLLLCSIILYFNYPFVVINSKFDDILIISIVTIFVLLLIYSIIFIKRSDIHYILPQILIFSFVVRAIPNFRLSYPPLHDPYFYFVTSLNIMDNGTLEPIYNWWYSIIDMQLKWPVIQLLTTVLYQISAIDSLNLLRFQEPAIGSLTFLVVYILTKFVTNDYKIAFIAALLASFNDILIFYQSEYHPQGLAIIIFIFIIFAYLKLNHDVRYRLIFIIFAISFIFVHHFSSLFIVLIFGLYLTIIYVLNQIKLIRNKFELSANDKLSLSIVILTGFMYHIFNITFVTLIGKITLISNYSLILSNSDVPLLTFILSSTKWIMFVLTFVSIIYIYKTKNMNEIQIASILICVLFAGVVGSTITLFPLDRIIGFYVPLASIFAALTLFRFMRYRMANKLVCIFLITILIVSGIFNSQIPAIFFKSSDINTFYWYSNKLPIMAEYKSAGEWIGKDTLKESIYATEFDSRISPFFYGNVSNENIYYLPDLTVQKIKNSRIDFIIFNSGLPYKTNPNTYFGNIDAIYHSGDVNIYKT